MPVVSNNKAQHVGAPPEQEQLPCPRCESNNTKFCYYNNYNSSQPRYFCKACRRYWTQGGALRNIPIGGGTRKNTYKRTRTSPNSTPQSSITQTTEPSNVSNPLNLPGSFTSLLNTPGADFVGLGFDNMGPGVWSSLMMNYGHFGGNTWQLGNDCHAALVDGDCINALARSYQKIAQVVHQSSPSLR